MRAYHAFDSANQFRFETRPQAAEHHHVDVTDIDGRCDYGSHGLQCFFHNGHGLRIALVPAVDQFVDGAAGRGGIAAGDSGRAHHGTPARIHFKAAATAATADGTAHVNGNMAQFATETVITAHHTPFADHRTADTHVGRHVKKRIRRLDPPRILTLRGIAGNLCQRGGIGLVAGNRIKSLDHIELLEIQTFPTEIARAKQSHIIGDETRQCQTGTGKHITFLGKRFFLLQSQFVETGENRPPVGVGLQSHAAQASTFDFKRNAGAPIQRLAGRRAFHQNLIVEHQRHQYRHGRFGQSGFLGKIGATHWFGGTQQRVEHHGKIMVSQIVLIDTPQ